MIDGLAPLKTGIISTGRAQLLPGSIWYEVSAHNVTGRVQSRFVARIGPTNDVTSQVIDAVEERPSGKSIKEVGALVVAIRSINAPSARSIVVAGPAEGDLGEITYDLIGFEDDAALGERLVVFVHNPEEGSDVYSLKSVESTDLCARGEGKEAQICP